MDATFIEELLSLLPEPQPFHYFADRESPWLLARALERRAAAQPDGPPARIADLKRSPLAPLLARPLVAELMRSLGSGALHAGDLAPLAEPERAVLPASRRAAGADGARGTEASAPAQSRRGAGARAAELAATAAWRAYSVTLASWGTGRGNYPWQRLQLSRPGGNLVLQLNFPSAHERAMSRLRLGGLRKAFEVAHHPVRQHGPITMAWARLDMDPWGEEMLIEELQSDWFRMVRWRLARLMADGVESRDHTALASYDRVVLAPYARDWERALLLAALDFATRELGVARVWMHQPEAGLALKNMGAEVPPRSLYASLPKRFLFSATTEVPAFLRRREKTLKRLRAEGRALFWVLDL